MSIVHGEPACSICREPLGRRLCIGNKHHACAMIRQRLATLAHNLAVAAGLCASFEMGRDAGPDTHVPLKTSWWRPGCGKPWSWPHITRDDQPGRVHSQTVVERGNGER